MKDQNSEILISEMAGEGENGRHQTHINKGDAYCQISEHSTTEEKILPVFNPDRKKAPANSFDTEDFSSFLTNLSHETRTPLHAIIGFAQYLKSGNYSKHACAQYMDIIINNGNRLLKVTDNLLYFYRIESGYVKPRREECSLNEELEKMGSNFYNLQNQSKNKEVAFKQSYGLPDGEDRLFIDRFYLNQVLIRLVDNAFKYTSQGKVVLSYELKSTSKLMFYVKDTGMGIPDEAKDWIFDASSQLQQQIYGETKGIGLGLNIAQKLVHLMGGELGFYSEAGKGSCFYFSLPCKFARLDRSKRKGQHKKNQLSPV